MEIAKTIAPVCLAIIMFGLGLGLTTSDFTRLLKTPRDFFVGFLSQVILLPVIAFGLILIIPMPIEIAMGVMIIAAAPGGVTSNVLTLRLINLSRSNYGNSKNNSPGVSSHNNVWFGPWINYK